MVVRLDEFMKMLLISKWTFLVSLILSVLTGPKPSFAIISCYECGKGNPDCDKKVDCARKHNYCGKYIVNGGVYFKGCTEAVGPAGNFFGSGKCDTKTPPDWIAAFQGAARDLEGRSGSGYYDLENAPPTDEVQICLCQSDYCNSGTLHSVHGLIFAVFFLVRRINGF